LRDKDYGIEVVRRR